MCCTYLNNYNKHLCFTDFHFCRNAYWNGCFETCSYVSYVPVVICLSLCISELFVKIQIMGAPLTTARWLARTLCMQKWSTSLDPKPSHPRYFVFWRQAMPLCPYEKKARCKAGDGDGLATASGGGQLRRRLRTWRLARRQEDRQEDRCRIQ